MKKNSQKKWLLPVLSCMGMMGTISTGHAAVTVHWEEDGTDVIATWSGTLALDAGLTTNVTLVGGGDEDASGNASLGHQYISAIGYYSSSGVGSPTSTSLLDHVESPSGEVNPAFGFAGGDLWWNGVHISGGSVGGVSELTFDPVRDIIRFSNNTLIGMNANNFDATLAWTATTTNDTISFTTGPAPVPEPSSTILLGLGSLSLLLRRKK